MAVLTVIKRNLRRLPEVEVKVEGMKDAIKKAEPKKDTRVKESEEERNERRKIEAKTRRTDTRIDQLIGRKRRMEVRALQPKELQDLVREKKLLDMGIASDSDAYSHAWFQQLSKDMRSRLPREIRDMIYKYLRTDDWLVEVRDDWYDNGMLEETFPLRKPWLRPDYVGLQMVREVVESNLPPIAFQVDCMTVIETLFETDIFSCGIKTVNVIRTLSIPFRLDDFEKEQIDGHWAFKPGRTEILEKMAKTFEEIQTLKRVRLRIFAAEKRSRDQWKVLLGMAPSVYSLRARGFDVLVAAPRFGFPEWGEALEGGRGQFWDFTKLFDEGAEDFERRLESQRRNYKETTLSLTFEHILTAPIQN
ncbi:hypothetical protein BU24DRAFT_80632 [Aaosphaeria arxii CBS 175.79]|uniref:Uncharacterized protein n=1 Tax=Aaosphaeria arxii CBS 175.79 TaxID=1450172 RepID=A0A6A5X9T1_9PLEO|nr:uncharacterized protein BU24DRAFT_80632 [Aaosphaeria arxii CBS 175.79]KAF2009669.1 hypothetical protein BU24DRAFT_80632 [Aaosphaeria arxii CBS 175.79]